MTNNATDQLSAAEQGNVFIENHLNNNYDRFNDGDLKDGTTRTEINACMRKFAGIRAIAAILKAAAAESNAHGAAPLGDEILIGLADALAELAVDGGIQIERLGIRLSAIEKERE